MDIARTTRSTSALAGVRSRHLGRLAGMALVAALGVLGCVDDEDGATAPCPAGIARIEEGTAEWAAAVVARDACLAEQTDCDGPDYIDRATAECIAEANGLEAGIAEWSSALVYNRRYGRVIWSVSNTLFDEGPPDYHAGGKAYDIDAATGDVLADDIGWQAIQ